jgi:hypothetical protein
LNSLSNPITKQVEVLPWCLLLVSRI